MMLNYLREYYIEQNFGPGYVMTNLFFIVAVVLLLNHSKWDGRGIRNRLLEMLVFWLGSVAFCGVCYSLVGHSMMTDRAMMLLVLLIYGVCFSKYKPVTRIVRSFVFYSCMMQSIPISEPIGEWFEEINPAYTWAEHLTSLVVVGMGILVLLFLRRFSTEQLVFVPTFSWVLVVCISGIGALLQAVRVHRSDQVLVAGSFWVITLLGYYMFYMVSQEYDRNLELLAVQHKQTLDGELLLFFRENHEELHAIRHELKNHLSYIKAMADRGEYGKLREYVTSVSDETEELFRFVECGNDVINAVMNHAIKQGTAWGVTIETKLIVPPEMPYKETELCSLLSNLMENALEAACQSGQAQPVVSVSIRPQLDYLFIQVTNPVNDSISARRRLSLRTTKEDQRTHGYGTKIIRNLAEKYQGSVKFDMKDGLFTVDVMLCLAEEENDGETVSGDL